MGLSPNIIEFKYLIKFTFLNIDWRNLNDTGTPLNNPFKKNSPFFLTFLIMNPHFHSFVWIRGIIDIPPRNINQSRWRQWVCNWKRTRKRESKRKTRKTWCQKVEEETVFEFTEETINIENKEKRITAELQEMRIHKFKAKARLARQNNYVKNLKTLSIVRASLSDELKIKGVKKT